MAIPKSSAVCHANWAFGAERYVAAQPLYGYDASQIPLIASGLMICTVGATPSVTLTLTDLSTLVVDGLVPGQVIPIRHVGVAAVSNVTSYIALFA
jgi:hypothetical protein